jgi:hypothetical protein
MKVDSGNNSCVSEKTPEKNPGKKGAALYEDRYGSVYSSAIDGTTGKEGISSPVRLLSAAHVCGKNMRLNRETGTYLPGT